MTTFPRQQLVRIQELGARLLESRKPKTDLEHLARDLLRGFFDLCRRHGLDNLFELDDDDPARTAAVVSQLGAIDLDGGGPRNARPGQLAQCVVAGLGLTLVDAPDRTITLGNDVRKQVVSALASVVEPELAVPKIRDTIIANARSRLELRYHHPFDRIAAELDERGMRIGKQLKIPLDQVQVVQRALDESRHALMDRVAGAAIDRAKAVLEGANPEAAARIDQPITHRLTPRDVAILRAADPRLPKVQATVVESLIDSLSELAHLSWQAAEKPVRTYSPKDTYAVGELIEHPKFGRGTVTAVSNSMPRVDVEFPDAKVTLVHVRK
ncbi:MAG TPA: hypothetical protein VLB44_19140 [Kofleriaceae bacterium]|nr:hypothetical protein [Kofleriaceae bacterium]